MNHSTDMMLWYTLTHFLVFFINWNLSPCRHEVFAACLLGVAKKKISEAPVVFCIKKM